MGQEVEIEIGMEDVRAALAESFQTITTDRLGEPGPNAAEFKMALSQIGTFLNAVTDEHIALLTLDARKVISNFLSGNAARFLEIDGLPEGRDEAKIENRSSGVAESF